PSSPYSTTCPYTTLFRSRHRGDDRRGRLAAHRRRRRDRRERVPQDHRPQEGHHHHRRRQEHQPLGDREHAEGVAVREGGGGHRRPAQVPHGAHRHRSGHRGQLGAAAPHRVHHLRRPVLQGGGR